MYYVLRLGSIRTVGILYGYLLYCVMQFYSVELTLSACVWDDRVMRYTAPDYVAGGAGEA